MELDHVAVRGAREHNLKSVDVDLPKKRLVVFTGVSGSGKSSLAFDTVFAEGQRRYVESLSAYARQFLGQVDKPKYDSIRGLAPTISIEQKTTSRNPRSTVGTITEISDYLRVLFARVGTQHCHRCGQVAHGERLTPGDTVVDIGAHIGCFALFAADRVGPTGRVIACEPDPDTCRRLERHVRLNGLGDIVEVERAPVAATPGHDDRAGDRGAPRAPRPGPEPTGTASRTARLSPGPIAVAVDRALPSVGNDCT